jgi:hypothetical protein
MSLVPIPSEDTGAACVNCAAALVPDQRYCLACGHPCSPVRLAFLDVLQDEHGRSEHGRAGRSSAIEMARTGYAPVFEPASAVGWLRRYSGLLGLLSVLLTSVLVGLLVGHWITQSRGPSQQVLKVEGLSGAPAVAATSTGAASPPAATTFPAANAKNASAAAEVAKEEKEANEPKGRPPAPVKANTQTLSKLTTTKGKQHQQEINKLTEGGKPIETGGGSSSSKPAASPKLSSESNKAGGGSSVTTIE